MRWIDTHCHLYVEPLWSNLGAVLDRAHERDVTDIVVPAYDLESWSMMRKLEDVAGIYTAYGIHPWVADAPFDMTELCRMLDRKSVVAVGEIGLDYKIESFDKETQVRVLRAQIELAIERGLPVMLHCRGAFDDMFAILGDYSPELRGVIHAFSRGYTLAERFVQLGLHVSFAGTITRSNTRRAIRSAQETPIDRILVETDAPSIGLDGIHPENVEPFHTAIVGEALARIKNLEVAYVSERTTNNAAKLFGID